MKLRTLLAPVSLLYRGGLALDRWVRTRSVNPFDLPVVSVGNLTMGGTGKTPFLIFLAQTLQQMGVTPAILTRGYKGVGASGSESAVYSDSSDLSAVSDEILELREALPSVLIGAGKNRRQTGLVLARMKKAEVFLLDDGFQHWPLARGLDIVLLDATDPFGGGLFPAGRAREPRSALKRAHVIVLNRMELLPEKDRGELQARVRKLAPAADIFEIFNKFQLTEAGGKEDFSMEILKGKKVLAVSAVGNPLAFEKAIENAGADLIGRRFMDHHLYSQKEWDSLLAQAEETGRTIVMTRKDWMKIRRLENVNKTSSPLILKVSADLSAKESDRFNARLAGFLDGKAQ